MPGVPVGYVAIAPEHGGVAKGRVGLAQHAEEAVDWFVFVITGDVAFEQTIHRSTKVDVNCKIIGHFDEGNFTFSQVRFGCAQAFS